MSVGQGEGETERKRKRERWAKDREASKYYKMTITESKQKI